MLPKLARCSLSLDIGAAHGVYSYWLSKISTSVIAYEPDIHWATALTKAKIPNLTVRNLAVSNKVGPVEMYIPQEDGSADRGLGSLNPMDLDAVRKITVQSTTLDSEALPSVGFIKMDIEGHETEALIGATSLIARDHPIIQVELDDRRRVNCITTAFSILSDHDYIPHAVIDDHLSVITEDEALNRQHDSYDSARPLINFIFVPKITA
jgi:FkbM family methyltransferase